MRNSEYYINNDEAIIYLRENSIFAKDKPSDRIYSTIEEIRNLVIIYKCH